MFQCCSLKSSHPCLLPHSPKVCSLHLCLFSCFTYDIIHISMSFSKIIPPLPSPTESKRLLYTSVSPLLSCIQGYLSKFYIYMCVSIPCWCFSFWLTSLCIIGSSFIHLIRIDSNAFFLMAE